MWAKAEEGVVPDCKVSFSTENFIQGAIEWEEAYLHISFNGNLLAIKASYFSITFTTIIPRA